MNTNVPPPPSGNTADRGWAGIGQPPPPQTPPPPAPRGYRSQEDKSKFALQAGILGAVFFIAQFALPFVIMFTLMPWTLMGGGVGLEEIDPQRAAQWQNRIYLVARQMSTRGTGPQAKLIAMTIDGEDKPAEVASLPVRDPWLVAGEDRLWIVSQDRIGFYRHEKVTWLAGETILGSLSRPFLYRGRPAVVDLHPSGFPLLVFENGEWTKRGMLRLMSEDVPEPRVADLQVLADGDVLHLFLDYAGRAYYRSGTVESLEKEDPESWQPVSQPPPETAMLLESLERLQDDQESFPRARLSPSLLSSWAALLLDGKPTVFGTLERESDRRIIGRRKERGKWKTFFTRKCRGRLREIGACPWGDSGDFVLLSRSGFGRLKVIAVRGGSVVSEKRHGGGTPFPRFFPLMMFIPHLGSVALPLILAFVLSGLMRKHRICEYSPPEMPGMTLPFASLGRRACAQIVDALIMVGPFLLSFLSMFFLMFERIGEMEESSFLMFAPFLGICFGFVWMLGVVLVFSALEGRRGWTPGKLAAGIRVLGTDLRPCGFGRALVRNLLKFIDGFFNFLVGILIAALTDNWQRLGDLAARTVVVRRSKPPTHQEVPIAPPRDGRGWTSQ